MAKYYWTTGPISSSLGLDHIIIDILNNTSVNRSVGIDVYDLSTGVPVIMFTKNVTIKPFSNNSTMVVASDLEIWEVQIRNSSKKIYMWVGGQDDAGVNLDGNIVLSSEFQLLASK